MKKGFIGSPQSVIKSKQNSNCLKIRQILKFGIYFLPDRLTLPINWTVAQCSVIKKIRLRKYKRKLCAKTYAEFRFLLSSNRYIFHISALNINQCVYQDGNLNIMAIIKNQNVQVTKFKKYKSWHAKADNFFELSFDWLLSY